MSEDSWLVVGLGNPGAQYAGTRHNVGHLVVDALARGQSFKAHRAQAVVASVRLGTLAGGRAGPQAVLAKPTTYMNLSGGPVAGLVRYFDVPLPHVVVVHDDLDIDFGRIKLKLGGGDGGHNGLKSVTRSLSSAEYVRVRCGIGRPPGRMDPADYVLRPYPPADRVEVELQVSDAADAVELVVTEGLEAAQGRFHTRP